MNLHELNTTQLEAELYSREQDAFYYSCEFPKTSKDFEHNINLQKAIKEVENEIFKRNMVAVFGKRDIVE